MRWAQITNKENCFQSQLLCDFLKQCGKEPTFEVLQCDADSFVETVKRAQKSYEGIRISTYFGDLAPHYYEISPSEMHSLKSADAMVKTTQGSWWLRSFLFKGLHLVFSEYGGSLDLDSSALIVGADARARVMASGILKMGFKKLNITSLNSQKGIELVGEIRKSHFDIEVQHIPLSNLVTLPGIHGVVCNSIELVKDNEDLESLYYFNFLKKGGLVCDLDSSSSSSALVKEAHEVGASAIGYEKFLSARDYFWVKQVFQYELDRKKYDDFLSSAHKA